MIKQVGIFIITIVLITCLIFLIRHFTQEKSEKPSENHTKNKAFPTDDNVFFAVQYRNSTNVPIIVWLMGDQPPCANTGADCVFKETDNWTTTITAKFTVLNENGDIISKNNITRNQTLQPGQTWRIELPFDKTGKPSWCFGKGNNTCPGVRSWFTQANVKQDVHANNGYTGLECNFNAGKSIDYDISGVDGLNANITVEYTGKCGNTNTYKKCLIELDNCSSMATKNGVNTCLSPSQKPGANDLAGCGLPTVTHSNTDPWCTKKMACHKWWADSDEGQKWLKFLQQNTSGECDAYGWAFDEMLYKDGDVPIGDNCDPGPEGGPVRTNNIVNPNIDCNQYPYEKNTYLNVDILKIL